jgi:sialate O-acetylesterase
MKNPYRIRTVLCALALAAATTGAALHANVKVPAIFGDNMVLQLGLPAPVFGTAAPGEQVTVAFAGQTKTATAGADGKWRVNLDPLTASKEPRELTITGANTLRFTNVLVGVVWLCSGQSNMEWQLQRSDNGEQEIAASANPNLRLFHVKKAWSDTPRDDIPLENTWAWAAAAPDTTPKFSGVGYFFGRALLKAFKEDVPVGLINSSWGGTRIEPWTSPAGFGGIPALADIDARIQSATAGTDANKRLTAQALAAHEAWLAAARAAAAAGKVVAPPPEFPKALRPLSTDNAARPQAAPTVLYNAMIHPFVPFAIQGAIWYQGEANLGDGVLYYDKLNALIASWRKEFENPALPLHIVQLAPYKYGNTTSLPVIWAAQERFARDDKYSGMAVINDVGNIENIHPTDKLTVGNRLSRLALNKTYGFAQVKCDSPAPADIQFTRDTAVITFANTAKLTTRDGGAPDWFEIAGADGWRKAAATIKGNTVTVRAAGVAQPAAVRYAWSGTAEPNLRDAESGLQVGAFTHGEIPPPDELARLGADAAGFQVLYDLDPLATSGHEVSYSVNNAASFAGKKIKRVAYYLSLVNEGGDATWAFVSLDAFSQDAKKLGVPTKNSGARFQQNVANLVVRTNVRDVKTGAFKQGNIEFWDCNYSGQNSTKVPGASDQLFDFGDTMGTGQSPGYGSMQIHNTAEKQTIIAYNNWRAGKACDLGIGNQPGGGRANPDWTFSKSGGKLQSARLLVLVETE